MFSRTWLAVLAGSLALWGMNSLGAGGSLLDVVTGGVRPRRAWSPAASAEVGRLAACLEQAASRAGAALREDPLYASRMPAVERWYREQCRPRVDGQAFDDFAVAYGERSRAAAAAILDREEALVAGVLGASGAGGLDPGVVWEAALGRAAADLRTFGDELVVWFEARASSQPALLDADSWGVFAPQGAPDDGR